MLLHWPGPTTVEILLKCQDRAAEALFRDRNNFPYTCRDPLGRTPILEKGQI